MSMWNIDTEPLHNRRETMHIHINIEHELFKSYLNERLKLYPSYIQYNTSWLNVLKPFQPYISPFPGEGAYRVRIGTEMIIKFPSRCLSIYREDYQRGIIKKLFTWLEEEYKMFQEQWKAERIIV